MQRRIFWCEGAAWVASREAGFLETAATLTRLLAQPAPDGAPPPPDLPTEAEAEAESAAEAEAVLEAEAEEAEETGTAADASPEAEAEAEAEAGGEEADAPPARPDLVRTAALVAAYLRRAPVSAEELPELIRTLHAQVLREGDAATPS